MYQERSCLCITWGDFRMFNIGVGESHGEIGDAVEAGVWKSVVAWVFGAAIS